MAKVGTQVGVCLNSLNSQVRHNMAERTNTHGLKRLNTSEPREELSACWASAGANMEFGDVPHAGA